MPIPITVDGVTYREGVDFTSEEYYGILTSAKAIPTTAQITLVEFAEAFQEEIAQGNRHLICVTITSQGSGIYNAACLARKMVLEKQPAGGEEVTIDVVDSAAYTYVYGHAVVKAAKAAREGMDREGVLELLHRELTTYQVYFGLTNLDFAKKSGRITSTAAFVGEVLGFRPLLTIHNGETDTIQKVRGDHKLVSAMVERFQKQATGDGRGSGGIPHRRFGDHQRRTYRLWGDGTGGSYHMNLKVEHTLVQKASPERPMPHRRGFFFSPLAFPGEIAYNKRKQKQKEAPSYDAPAHPNPRSAGPCPWQRPGGRSHPGPGGGAKGPVGGEPPGGKEEALHPPAIP